MKTIAIIGAGIACILVGCSAAKGPREVIALYYSASATGDLDAFLSCLSPAAKQECLARFADRTEARTSFTSLPEEARELARTARVTKVETQGKQAMVWVTQGESMPEDGLVFSLTRSDERWMITDVQMLVAFYRNGSKRDWEKTTESGRPD